MTYRKTLNFNTDWYFTDKDISAAKDLDYDQSEFIQVNLPHPNKVVPHHYFDQASYQFISWYRRPFFLKEQYRGKRILVEFDGVMSLAEVYVNGQLVGEHKGGYTSFVFDITNYLFFNQRNLLAVRVDSTRRTDIPPEGGLVDYLLFGGIYRNVRMLIVDPLHINWVFLAVEKITKETAEIRPGFSINNRYERAKEAMIITSLINQENKVIAESKTTALITPGGCEVEAEKITLAKPELWSTERPYLYKANIQISLADRGCDDYQTRIGVRKFEFREDGKFYLNNQALKLRGLNRHQLFPYLGAAMPDRGQRKDAEILKYGLGLNFVRLSHYPVAPSFLDCCDEIGLLLMEELPGWQHIGNSDWKKTAKKNLEEMIIRDRNHASIFLWGVRINESEDDHDFYLETNKIAHSLDQTRLTIGVRNFQESEFLEDVFGYNDFELNQAGKIKVPTQQPYMITEFMGHMYPTKAYDSIERLINQATRHAKIQDSQYGMANIAGAAGWCAFDYNTHVDFGSGDRICYHGVCDMFRLPKFAAYFYQSQLNPAIEKVVFIAKYLIPSFNEDYGDEVIVFSNCEVIELYSGEELVETAQPNRLEYPHLPHPPFTFKGYQGWKWGGSAITSLKAVGKIKGEKVAQHVIYPFGRPERLSLKADFSRLIADGSDCTRVVVELKDENDQTLHLAHHPVFFEVIGPARLIGENPFSLEAGRGAVYIQTGRSHGRIGLKASVPGLPSAELWFEVSPIREEIVPIRKGD